MTAPSRGRPTPAPLPRAHAILIIDDEPHIRRAVKNALQGVAERMLEAGNGAEGIDVAAAEQPELVILDLGLPDMPGVDVCRELRAWSGAAIIVLSARHSEHEKVELLDAGAEDYVTKPFSIGELEARVRVQLRRIAERDSDKRLTGVRRGEIALDFVKRAATKGAEAVHLTRIEWKIARVLAGHHGRTLTHRQIFDAVWGREFGDPQRYLRVHITHLRRKLEADPTNPAFIVTDPGVGYRLEADDQAIS